MSNRKIGLSFYTLDTDRYQDIRIKKLKKEIGCIGIAVYDYILCEIYRVKGCFLEWDKSTAFDVADYLGLKETQVNEVVNYCCVVGLFDKELLTNGRVLTSLSIQSRYIEMCTRAKRTDIKIPEKYKIIPEESPKLPEESPKLPEVCPKVKESIVKESNKEREKREIPPPPEKEDFSVFIEKPLSECSEYLKNSQEWKERFCMNNHYRDPALSPNTIDSLIDSFIKTLENRGIDKKSFKDCREHFANWYNGELDKKKRANGNPDKYDRKRQDSEQRKLDTMLEIATTGAEAARKRKEELEAAGII